MFTRRQFIAAGTSLGIGPRFVGAASDRMLARPIPVSGDSLPVVGLGTWQVFDVDGSARELSDRQQIVEALFDAGGNVIDTSPMYRRSERVVGDVLASSARRDQAFLATKVWTNGEAEGRRQMRKSAELLQIEQIDLMQVHNRRDIETHWPTIREYQQDGFIRYSGITDYRDSADDAMMALMRRYRPDFIQINYSLLERGAERGVLPLARELGVAVLINRPFVSGSLFSAVRGHELPGWAEEVAASWGQFFLKFIVSHPAVTCVIPATSKLRHMVDNAGAGFGPMPDTVTRQRMVEFIEAL